MKPVLAFIILFASILSGSQAQDAIPEFYFNEPGLFKNSENISKTFLKKIPIVNDLGFFAIIKEDSIKYYGAVNKQGKIKVEAKYKQIINDNSEVVVFKKDNGFYELYSRKHGSVDIGTCDTFKIDSRFIFYRKHFEWGVVYPDGKEIKIFEAKYKDAFLNHGTIVLKKFNEWKLDGESTKACCLYVDTIYFLTSDHFAYKKGVDLGIAKLKDNKFKLAPLQYSSVELLYDSLLKVNSNNKYGISGINGKTIIPAEFDSIHLYKDIFEVYQQGKGWKLYDINGHALNNTYYCNLGVPSDGMIAAQFHTDVCKSWGYIDVNGNIAIDAIYNHAKSFRNDSAEVEFEGKSGIIDKKGNWLIDPQYFPLFNSGLYTKNDSGTIQYLINPDKYTSLKPLDNGLILAQDNNYYGIISDSVKLVIPIEYDRIRGPFGGESFIVYKGNQFAIIDFKGNTLYELSDRFERIDDYHENRARVLKAGKFGFIDQRGNVRVAPQYKEAHNFKEGLAAVPIIGKWGFIDKDENIVVQPQYSEVKDFKNGLARCKAGKQWFFLTAKGSKVSELGYDEILEGEEGKWIIKKNGKYGIADISGRELLSARYEFVVDMLNGNFIVKKLDKWGVVDSHENFIIPFEYDFIKYDKQNKILALMVKSKEDLIEVQNVK